MKVIKHGKKVEMSYDEICAELGFRADVHFVTVTTANTIGFSAGKLHEIKALLRACNQTGYKPSKALQDIQ